MFSATGKKISFLVALSIATLSVVNATSIGDIDLQFCNPEDETGVIKTYSKTLQLKLDEGQEGSICMKISNTSNEDVRVKIGFVDGTISNDFDQKKVCKNEGDNTNFGKFVKMNTDSVIVPADGSVIKNAKINFPKGYGGMVHGCVTYYMTSIDQLNQGGSSFDILVRKASFVDVLVNGDFDLGLEFLSFEKVGKFNWSFFNIKANDKIKIFKNDIDKKLTFQIGLRNVGRINQDVNIVGKITNFLGYEKVFQSGTKKILGQDEVLISDLIEQLPFYKGPFDIKYEVSYTPDFEFETDKINSDMRQTKYVLQEATFFVMPWLIIIVLFVLISLIIIFVIIRIRYHNKKLKQILHDKSFYLHYDNKEMPTKKVAAKKVAKKAPAKKVATKKVAKKAPAKKVATKKVAKKAPAKKAVKKVAKKK